MEFCSTERMQNAVLLKMSNTMITEDICLLCCICSSFSVTAPRFSLRTTPLFFLNPADSTISTRDRHLTYAWPIKTFHPSCHSDWFTDTYVSQDRPMRFNAKTSAQTTGKEVPLGFPGGTVVKNPPANAGDTGSSPGPGRSHTPWSN